MLWTNQDHTAFYSIPRGAHVADGDLLLRNSSGETCTVDEHDAAAFVVDEAATNDIVQAQIMRFRRTNLSPETVQAIVAPIFDAMNPLLDDRASTTSQGRARLERVAQAVRDSGGPDWTSDPESLPRRLRDALIDPALTPAVQEFVESMREASRQARAARGEPDET